MFFPSHPLPPSNSREALKNKVDRLSGALKLLIASTPTAARAPRCVASLPIFPQTLSREVAMPVGPDAKCRVCVTSLYVLLEPRRRVGRCIVTVSVSMVVFFRSDRGVKRTLECPNLSIDII